MQTFTNVKAIMKLGRAMAQAARLRPLTAGARVRARDSLCEICGGQSGTETGFSQNSRFFPVSIIPPGLHTRISCGGLTTARWWPQFKTQSNPTDMNNSETSHGIIRGLQQVNDRPPCPVGCSSLGRFPN
jgi:hypothetical protein